MISVDPNRSAANLSFFPMEIPRISSNPDPEFRVSKIEDGPSSVSSPSRSRVSESSDLSLSIHGFETGDMVWGRVQSHPWWPGYIFNEAFASPSVRRTKTGGHVLVAFFGDSSYGWFDPSELVPFAPTFFEKSKQTAARSFLNAVEESIDEFCRRAALGLSCMCRNPYSFRPTTVPGYYAVDVPGFERGGIYSAEQIEMARKEFVPEESLSFVRRLALAPLSTVKGDVECIKKTATVLTVRKLTYEEFDDTYAEAFGVQPVRPALDNLDEEPEKFAPRVAPLSGPLVIPEPLGSSNSRSSFPKHSLKKKNKNKYLIKRRSESVKTDDRKPVPMSSLPPPPVDAPPETTLPSLCNTQTPASVLTDCKLLPADSKHHIDGSESKSVIGKENKEKVKKRPQLHDGLDNKCELVEKKKKKREGSKVLVLKELAMGINDTRSQPTRTLDHIVSAPKLDLERLKWSDLLNDLSALASDPYYGVERNAPPTVRHVFLKFRSAVYQKSLVPPLASNADDDPKERKEKTPNVKQGSLVKRYRDPSNAGTKRPLSNLTEEVPAKRIKKLHQIRDKEKAASSTSADPPARQEPLLPLPPKTFTPTNLIMKFPPNSTLPSVSELKARFVRFGKLVDNRCRVKWEEYECRVQFKYKVDALKAYESATGKGIFGKIQVSYRVKEVKLPSEPQPESSLQFRLGNGSGNSVAQPRPIGPLKSILKKPGHGPRKEGQRIKFKLDADESMSVPTAAAVVVGSRDAPLLLPSVRMTKPMKFAPPLSPPLPKPTSFLPPSQPSATCTLETMPPATFLLPSQATTRPMPPPQPSVIRAFDNRLPPNVFSESHLRRQVQLYGGAAKEEESRKSNDVAHEMLSVLRKIDDTVAGLKSLPGFVLYRSI